MSINTAAILTWALAFMVGRYLYNRWRHTMPNTDNNSDVVQVVMTRRVAAALGVLARSATCALPTGTTEYRGVTYTPAEWTAIHGVIASLCINEVPPKPDPDNVIISFGSSA